MEARGPDVATWIGYGGALGGAKSGAIRRIMLMRRGKYPKTIGVIMRRVLADVKENHIQKYWEEYPELRQYYNSTDYEIQLPNASRIKFMYAENSMEVDRKFYGPEFFISSSIRRNSSAKQSCAPSILATGPPVLRMGFAKWDCSLIQGDAEPSF